MTTMSRERVLITGASRGIGRAVAIELARCGRDVVLWSRSRDELEAVAELCRAQGAAAWTLAIDVGRNDLTWEAARASLESLGDLSGAVVNAGIGRWSAFADCSWEDWRNTLGTNLDGAFLTLKTALPRLAPPAGGRVVAISSDSSEFGFRERAAYCASKWGLCGLVESLREEYRGAGIRFTNIFVSRVDTHFREQIPGARPRALKPEDVARAVSSVFDLPRTVEMREMKMSSIDCSYGPR